MVTKKSVKSKPKSSIFSILTLSREQVKENDYQTQGQHQEESCQPSKKNEKGSQKNEGHGYLQRPKEAKDHARA